jgi:hypothetical protein
LAITGIPATYAHLLFTFTGLSSNTATRKPFFQPSQNNGSSYDTTASNYNNGAGVDASLTDGLVTVPAASTFTGYIYIFGYQGNTFPIYMSKAADSGLAASIQTNMLWYIGSISAINALRMIWNGTGNSDAGTYALYGIL